ncbi:ankyrin repeat protein [Colletotrichum plurivorum]|uniref:Ankyrin repeat protein n=1 Tax=Colletotrichum plurivorum TaxID=2175906 RepID=A0A8H6NBD7_9PEZI|nr:ankyrin repeat protein [Colletotrichum plurivorum]
MRSVKQWARSLKAGRSTSQNPTGHAETLSRPSSSLQSPKPGRIHNQANNEDGPIAGTETLSELPSHRDGSSSTVGAVVGASRSDDSAVSHPIAPDDAGAEKQISGSIAIDLWNDAFQVVKNDKNMEQLLQEHEPVKWYQNDMSILELSKYEGMAGDGWKGTRRIRKTQDGQGNHFGSAWCRQRPQLIRCVYVISTPPPAAMVWAGVCAAIPIVTLPLEEDQKMVNGLKYICERALMYFALPDQLLRGANRDADLSRTGQSIRATVQNLYQHTLEFVILSTQYRAEASTRKEKRKQFLDNLKGTDYKERLLATRKRVKGTCQWFCENRKFHEWLHESGGLLVVSADAGCGKSVLARYLIEEVLPEHDPEATICYFLFRDDDPEARSFTNAAKALLHNLLESHHELADCWRERLHSNSNQLNGLRQLCSTLSEASMSTNTGSVICVLDALDESDQGELQAFIDCLSEYILSKPRDSRPKFLLTTRGYPQILNKFIRLSHTTVSLDGEDEDEMASRSCLEQEIHSVTQDRLARLFEQRPDIGEKAKHIIQSGLSQKGSKQATYLWMHLMFEVLEKTYPRNPKNWNKLFDGPPGDIAQAYEKLLQHVNAGEKDAVRATLGLIIVAKHPLSPGELLMALNARDNLKNPCSSEFYEDLSSPEEFTTWLRRECGSFVSVFARRVYLIHQTAKEFLITARDESAKSSSNSVWQGSIAEIRAHRYMAESCVVSLSFDEFNISSSRNRFFSQHPEGYTGHLSAFEHGPAHINGLVLFTKYASIYLLYHFRNCQHQTERDTLEKVVDNREDYSEMFYTLFRREDSELWKWSLGYEPRLSMMLKRYTDLAFPEKSNEEFNHFKRVTCLACHFDNLRLLKFALDEWERYGEQKGRILDSNTSRTQTNFSRSLPKLAVEANAELCLREKHAGAAIFLIRMGANLEIRNEEGLKATELYKKLHAVDLESAVRDWEEAEAQERTEAGAQVAEETREAREETRGAREEAEPTERKAGIC